MTWFKVDDQSSFHPKIMKAGNEAWGAVCRAGAWSSNHGTDGQISWEIALRIGSKPVWNRAEKSGLIERVTDEGFWIHDFLHWNPSAEATRAERARKAKNIADLRARRKAPSPPPVTEPVTGDIGKVQPVTYHGPDPDPDPDHKEARGAAPSASPEHSAIAGRIRAHREFADLDADRIAEHALGFMMTGAFKLDWVLTSIDVCAARIGSGDNARTRQASLVGFMRKANLHKPESNGKAPATSVAQSAEISPERAEVLRKAQAEKRAKAEAARAHAEAQANGGKHA